MAARTQQCALESAVAEPSGLTARELEVLIRRYEAPAALKLDNGLSLRCAEAELVPSSHGILALVSPPRCPG